MLPTYFQNYIAKGALMLANLPTKVFEHVKEAFRRYYDSQFWLKDERLMEERANLLERNKVYSPLVEESSKIFIYSVIADESLDID